MKNSKSILLVENDKDDQEFFIEALRQIGNVTSFEVANNGRDALDRLQNAEHLPDLIFTDINMPGMNGIDCLSAIINNPKMSKIPVVMLTSATGQRELAQKIGARGFIEKTWNGKTLRGKLEQMINLDFITDSHIANQTFKTTASIA